MSIEPGSRALSRALAALLVCVAARLVIAQGPQIPVAVPDPSFVAGELLVKFRPGASTARRNSALGAQTARVLRRFDADLQHIGLAAGETVESAVAAFAANPDVLYAQPNYIRGVSESTPPNDPYWVNGTLYGLQKIMARPAWINFTSGDGSVVVAHVDTGMNYNHPDLVPNVWTNPGESGPTAQQGPAPNCTSRGLALDKSCNNLDDDGNGYVDDLHGIDTFNHDSDPMDDHGHGTKTAGVLGAVGNNGVGVVGVSWNVKMVSCKIFGADGLGPESAALECFNYLLALKSHGVNIRVSTNSWGQGRPAGTAPSQALSDAFDGLGNAGILNIAAAGNYGTNTDVSSPFDPAAFAGASIVSVAASDELDNRADFSNYGPTTVDLAAPGVNIITTTKEGDYGNFYGTSAATPYVSGAAALLFTLKPNLTVAAAKALLMNSVDHLGQWTNLVGSGGRLNVFGLLLAAAGDISPTVSITSPATGTTIASGAVSLAANASDGDGSISSVTFLANGTAIGSDSSSPYTFSWTPPATGDYALTAVATDNLGATTTSATVNIHYGSGGGGGAGSATFVKTDLATVGNWHGVYGAQGYSVAQDTASLPAYAQMTMTGQAPYTWTGSTTDSRALQRATVAGRLAALWYSYSSFTIDIVVTDGQSHQVAIYGVDWDSVGRSEQVDVIDPQTAAVLDTKTLSSFSGGKYLVWNVSGHVAIKVTNKGPGNAAVSGVFFDPPGNAATNQSPSVSITSPASGATINASPAITVSASATDSDGSVSTVTFLANGAVIGTDTTSPFSVQWSPNPGDYTLTAVATDNLGATASSASVLVHVVGNSAPTVSVTSPANGASFGLGVPITVSANASDSDGTVSSVAFYANGSPIGSDSSSPYSISWTPPAGGSYTVTAAATDNQGATTTSAGMTISVAGPSNNPPAVSVTAPANNTVVSLGAVVTVSASAADSDGTVTQVQFFAGATPIGTDPSSPYSISYSPPSTGTYVLTAVATDNGGATTTSAAVTVTVVAGGGGSTTAAFVRTDTTTKGTWKQVYGTQGYTLAGEGTSLPAYAQVAMTGQAPWTWTGSTSDVRALQLSAGSSRIAALWYSYTSFTIDVTLTDNQTHQIGLYALDWDSVGRSEQFDVIDAQTAAVLDTRTVSGFSGGQYLFWNVSGHVQIKVTNKGPGNAGVSAVFFDAAGGVPSNTPPTVSLTAPANGASFTLGTAITVSANASDSDGTVASVAFSANGSSIGSDASSPFSISWTPVSAGTYSLTALATDNLGATTTSAPISITVTSSNSPPTVSLTAPANGASFTLGSAITVSANASDSDGTVASVAFSANGSSIGSDASSPFSISWTPVSAGTYSLTALATDNLGATATSAPVSITVTSPNSSPTVNLTAPANGASFTLGTAVTVSANASDSDGTVASVAFSANGSSIGSDASSPFSISWTPASAGTYSLTAVATDNLGATTTSAAVTITVTAGGGGGANTAAFVRSDTTAKGTWKNVYGNQGYSLAADAASLPVYAQVTMAGVNPYTWASSTTDVRALQRAVGSTRFAALWYTYTSLTVDVTITDAQSHQISMYFLDWDSLGRSEQVDVLDAQTSAVLDTRTIGGFSGGLYLVWNVSGHVTIKVTNKGPGNGAVSGVFFDAAGGAPANAPPTVSLTAPANGASFTLGTAITVSANASDSDGTVASVAFFANGSAIGSDASSPFSISWTPASAGTYSLTSVATDNLGATTTSAAISITVTSPNSPPTVSLTSPASGTTANPAPPSIPVSATANDADGTVASVAFYANGVLISTDTSSPFAVDWSPAAGSYSLTAVATDNLGATTTSSPVTVTVTGQNSPPTVSLTAPSNGASFPSGTPIIVSADASDSNGTVSSVAFLANGSLIGTDTISPFAVDWTPPVGSYSLTAVATDNLGATTTSSPVTVTVTAPNSPPTVSLTAPANGATFASGVPITVSANASDSNGTVSSVAFFANGSPIGSDSSSPFSISWTPAAAGDYSLTAVATDNSGATTTSSAVAVHINPAAGTTASFLRLDTTTRGTWRNTFGVQGYSLAADTTSLPSYAQLSLAGQSSWTWTSSTTDTRALQKGLVSGRQAAAWYSWTNFTFDLRLTDGSPRQIAVYAVDWDGVGRTEKVEILNADTGVVLDTRTLSGFGNGQYLVWTVSGHVTIRLTNTGSGNGVISGLFID